MVQIQFNNICEHYTQRSVATSRNYIQKCVRLYIYEEKWRANYSETVAHNGEEKNRLHGN